MVKLVANMHGNEVVGREMLLKLAGLLLTRSQEQRIARILNNIDLHILVSLNPDGFERIKADRVAGCGKVDITMHGRRGRLNANNVRM